MNNILQLLRNSIFLVRYSALLLLLFSGCTKLITVPVETAGKITYSAIEATGKVAAETVKAGGKVACAGIQNPNGAATAATRIP